jgi:hypothetical protein
VQSQFEADDISRSIFKAGTGESIATGKAVVRLIATWIATLLILLNGLWTLVFGVASWLVPKRIYRQADKLSRGERAMIVVIVGGGIASAASLLA